MANFTSKLGAFPAGPKMSLSVADEKAQLSARDALACKYSASCVGYYYDPYVRRVVNYLSKQCGCYDTRRRSPLIHRGYFARYDSFNRAYEQFISQITRQSNANSIIDSTVDSSGHSQTLETSSQQQRPQQENANGCLVQVVHLGAGFDTFTLLPYYSTSSTSPAANIAASANAADSPKLSFAPFLRQYAVANGAKAEAGTRAGASFKSFSPSQQTDEMPQSRSHSVRTFEVDFEEVAKVKHKIYSTDRVISRLLLQPVDTSETTTGRKKCEGKDQDQDQDAKTAAITSCHEKRQSETTEAVSTTGLVGRVGPICFIGQDLRNADVLFNNLIAAGFDITAPTIIFSECVLVYIEKQFVDAVAAVFASRMHTPTDCCTWVTYDMINPSDIFGKMMHRNLTLMGFSIPGLKDFPDLTSQERRFLENGWKVASSVTMKQYYDRCISAECKAEMNKLEMLDEVEEFNMLMDHYSLTIAVLGGTVTPQHKLPLKLGTATDNEDAEAAESSGGGRGEEELVTTPDAVRGGESGVASSSDTSTSDCSIGSFASAMLNVLSNHDTI